MSVLYIGPKSRTERPRKTKIATEIAHVTRDVDTTFKRSRSPGRFTQRGLKHKVAAAVSVGTYLAWESTAMLRLLDGEKNGGAYCVVTRTACSMFIASVTRLTLTTEAREIGFYSC